MLAATTATPVMKLSRSRTSRMLATYLSASTTISTSFCPATTSLNSLPTYPTSSSGSLPSRPPTPLPSRARCSTSESVSRSVLRMSPSGPLSISTQPSTTHQWSPVVSKARLRKVRKSCRLSHARASVTGKNPAAVAISRTAFARAAIRSNT